MRGKERHELACANCGAPLHDLKHLRADPQQSPVSTCTTAYASRPKEKNEKRRKSKPASFGAYVTKQNKKPQKSQKRAYKKKKSAMRWFLKEAFDVIEDIFD